jgi:hypothetical protein
MALRTDYNNTTALTDQHPTAHNDVNGAVNALDAIRGRRAAPGRWIYAHEPTSIAPVNIGGYANHALLARTVVHSPFDALTVKVTTAVAASTWLAGVYRTDAYGMPSTLGASGPIDSSATGMKVVTFAALPAGTYWLAFWSSVAIGAACHQAGNQLHVMAEAGAPPDISPQTGWAYFIPSMVSFPPTFPSTGMIGSVTAVAAMLRCA